MKNVHSFWNWQGNQLEFTAYPFYAAVALMFVVPIIYFIYRRQLNTWIIKKETTKIIGFKNINSLLQWVGVMGLIYTVFRIGFYGLTDYPLYWEYLYLHLCRFHLLLISILFLIKKKEVLQYIAPIAFAGAIIALLLGGTYGPEVGSEAWKNSIYYEKGFTFYNAGPDTFFYWDMLISHSLLSYIPMFFLIALKRRFTFENIIRSLLIYMALALTFWIIDLATFQQSDKAWQSNFWYFAPDKANDNANTLGLLTHWPQSLFFYLLIGYIVYFIFVIITLPTFGDFKVEYKKLFSKEAITKTKLRELLKFRKLFE